MSSADFFAVFEEAEYAARRNCLPFCGIVEKEALWNWQNDIDNRDGRMIKKEEKYLEMTDAFLRQSSKGEIPDKITQDLRFCIDEQQEKLQQKGVTIKEEYIFDDEAVTGTVEACNPGF